ncbi:TonB-dependent receptor [Chitinophaga sancti]|uniref:TonB-dependent siderophore receptor n=1 Tax=Chitinophaga sancti TaxID=1004 RepID=UPI002A75F5CE|nr:TonB-dependent receptor [Chitinophaga sancti]WPQ60672.1 TonB-dependent receptor [Chitinophaga sancti]
MKKEITGIVMMTLALFPISAIAQEYGKKDLDTITIRTKTINVTDSSSFQAARLPIKDYENPQVVSSVNGRLIANRNNYTQSSMLNNVAGITPSWAGIAPNITIRGFRTRPNFRNGLNAFLAYNSETINIKQLDVIKGPAGTLFGSANVVFGGIVNSISYKPEDATFTNIELAGGNNNFQRGTIDINTFLDSSHYALFRLMGAYTYKESFQDDGLYRNIFLAPGFSYKVTQKLQLELEAEFERRTSTNSTLLTPANPLVNGVLTNTQSAGNLHLDYKKSYTDNSLLWRTTGLNLYARAIYTLSNRWRSETNLVSVYGTSNGTYQTNTLVQNNAAVARKMLYYNPENMISQQVQQNFTGDFRIANWRNRLVAGIDYYHYIYLADYSSLGRNFDTVSIANPGNTGAKLTEQYLLNLLNGSTPYRTKSEQNIYSAYLSDVLNPIEALSITLSARVDHLNNLGTLDQNTGAVSGKYNQTAFSPKLGITWQLIPRTITVFINYMNGFQNVAPTSQSNGTVMNFKPQYGNQLEGGVKISTGNRKLNATFSYYDINVSNVLRTSPNDNTLYIQDGKQYSRGLEADLSAQPFPGLFIHAGSAYNNSKLTLADANTQGLRPVNSGPEWSANWYVNYRFLRGAVSGFSAGLGGFYVGRDLIINSKSAGQFYTDEYTLFNGTVSYEHNRFTWAFTADNLLNTKYYYGGRGFISPGALRQCIISVKMHF